ncbi:MAG: Hsp70 family protein [Planctomycetota bacterium]
MASNSPATSKRTDPIVGIDLGTTNSLVAHATPAGPRVLGEDLPEGPILPSVVRYSPDGSTVEAIGQPARKHAVEHPTRTVHSAKRLMGRSLQDLDPTEAAALPYRVVEGDQNTARIAIGDAVISPQEVAAALLAELRQRASDALGTDVTRAVITVPAYFDDAQRQATRDAARLAGLEPLRILNEPTAAALAYHLTPPATPTNNNTKPTATDRGSDHPKTIALNTKLNPDACATAPDTPHPTANTPAAPAAQTIAVYDLGGGTFDLSLLRLEHTEHGTVDQVLATAGDTHLGGDDLDQAIIAHLQQGIAEHLGHELDFPPSTRQAFRQLAEAAKIRLSTHHQTPIEIDLSEALGDHTDTDPIYKTTLTRDQLNAFAQPLINRTLDACRYALRYADLTPDDIDRVVMVGGSTRIPAVRDAVADFFHTEPYTALDPDRVVALGAAVQAAILAGDHPQQLLLDVIPLSLGIETMGGAVAKLITANTTIPATATERFSTYAEGQTSVAINIYQGERELVQNCRLLGTFDLTGIPPMPAGLPKLVVTFLVDANGILTVSALEERSGKNARVQVVPNHGLTPEEITRIETESLQHARQDMTAHRLIDLKNQARLDLRAIDRQLDRVGDALDPKTRANLGQHIATVQQLLDAGDPDPDVFYQALTDMDHASIPLAEKAIAQTLREAQPDTAGE